MPRTVEGSDEGADEAAGRVAVLLDPVKPSVGGVVEIDCDDNEAGFVRAEQLATARAASATSTVPPTSRAQNVTEISDSRV